VKLWGMVLCHPERSEGPMHFDDGKVLPASCIGPTTRLVVQDRLAPAFRLRLVKPLEEINAALGFHTGFG
jgi:hypothetical protein